MQRTTGTSAAGAVVADLKKRPDTQLAGGLDNFLPAPIQDSKAGSSRQQEYPEQYPATYECSKVQVASDSTEAKKVVRPLLKQTQLESRPLQTVYDANIHGWNCQAFHKAVDGKGAAVVLARHNEDEWGATVRGCLFVLPNYSSRR